MSDESPLTPRPLAERLPSFARIERVPGLPLEAPNAVLDGREIVLLRYPVGRRFRLRFGDPFEPLIFDESGERLTKPSDRPSRGIFISVYRLLPNLMRILDDRYGLHAVLTEREGLMVTAVVELGSGRVMDHAQTRDRVAPALSCPAFAWLGATAGLAEVQKRARLMFASGAEVELRREDHGRVLGTRRFIVD